MHAPRAPATACLSILCRRIGVPPPHHTTSQARGPAGPDADHDHRDVPAVGGDGTTHTGTLDVAAGAQPDACLRRMEMRLRTTHGVARDQNRHAARRALPGPGGRSDPAG